MNRIKPITGLTNTSSVVFHTSIGLCAAKLVARITFVTLRRTLRLSYNIDHLLHGIYIVW
jgi:hypothetical protein